jgi:hypothetical protein
MEKTLQVLNRMVNDGVIDDYAIGGAVAAVYYLEPIDTADLDVFIDVSISAKDLALLAPIYSYLGSLGFFPKGEHVFIEEMPVRFLPPFNPLIAEAIRNARAIVYGETPTRIMTAEHLAAIMLQTGRPKDFVRIGQFLDAGAVDRVVLDGILKRYQLDEKWEAKRARFES